MKQNMYILTEAVLEGERERWSNRQYIIKG